MSAPVSSASVPSVEFGAAVEDEVSESVVIERTPAQRLVHDYTKPEDFRYLTREARHAGFKALDTGKDSDIFRFADVASRDLLKQGQERAALRILSATLEYAEESSQLADAGDTTNRPLLHKLLSRYVNVMPAEDRENARELAMDFRHWEKADGPLHAFLKKTDPNAPKQTARKKAGKKAHAKRGGSKDNKTSRAHNKTAPTKPNKTQSSPNVVKLGGHAYVLTLG